jgi:predicted flap endonuclease-1-like 5' DNA nuclease
MGYRIDEIEGIGPAFKQKLGNLEINTTEDLLEHCADAGGRKATSEKTGIGDGQLLKWANMADMMRISGVGPQFAELLEASGVDTVKELQHRNAENLAAKMAEVNATKNLANASPAASTVEGWIGQAKGMPPKISH